MSDRQSPLPPAPRAHQLPPKWDDCTVEWGEWQRDNSSMRYHTRPDCCPNCGSLTERVLNVGKLRSDGTRVFLARRARSGYQPGRLFAWRCPDCKHDQVTDLGGVTWDLAEYDPTPVLDADGQPVVTTVGDLTTRHQLARPRIRVAGREGKLKIVKPSDAYPGTVTLIWADCWEDAALEEPCEVLP